MSTTTRRWQRIHVPAKPVPATPALATAAVLTAAAGLVIAGPGPAVAASDVAASDVAASDVAVSGTLGSQHARYQVELLTPDGASIIDRADARGRFAMIAPGGEARGASLQLFTPDGQYVGPIVLAVDDSADPPAAHLRLSGRPADLGVISVDEARGFALALDAEDQAHDSRTVRSTRAGRPDGAGRAGLVRTPGPSALSDLIAASGAFVGADELAPHGGVLPGEDRDSDGIPNLYDVDDDGDLTLDVTDPGSTSGPDATALDDPWTTLVQDPAGARNAHTSDIDPHALAPAPESGEPSPASMPLPVTVALVNLATTGAVDALRLLPDDGSLGLMLWRPQRLALPGETGDLRDIGGLRYGVVMSIGDAQFGCDAARYSALDGLLPGGVGDDRELWPLVDATPSDLELGESAPVGFTLDVTGCLADAAERLGSDAPRSGELVRATVGAAGQHLAAGTTVAGVSYLLVAP